MLSVEHKEKKTLHHHQQQCTEQVVDDHLAVFILYYCFMQWQDKTKYTLDLKSVADVTLTFDEYGDKQISAWKMPYPQPSLAFLQTYELSKVLQWYRLNYELPARVLHNETGTFVTLTQNEMHNMATVDFVRNQSTLVIFNSTFHKLFYFNRDLRSWKPM